MTAVTNGRALLRAARSAAADFNVEPIRIDPARILRMHGYREFAAVRPRVREVAIAMANAADQVLQPSVKVRCLPFHRSDTGALVFDAGVRLQCAAFQRYLRDCNEAVLFVLSAGAALDEQISCFMHDSQPLDALFLNTAGWLCVEMMTRQLANTIKSAALDEAMRLTRRLGPGYSYRVDGVTCAWDLQQQRELFALIGEPQLAVTLLDSGGMQPQMSRSGLFGLGPLGHV